MTHILFLFATFNSELDFISFQWQPQALVFDFVASKTFDRIILLLVGLNMLTLALDRYEKTATTNLILNFSDILFLCIFSAECLIKMFALRFEYFGKAWNLFDFAVAITSIIGEIVITFNNC